jgi:ProQ/FINO family
MTVLTRPKLSVTPKLQAAYEAAGLGTIAAKREAALALIATKRETALARHQQEAIAHLEIEKQFAQRRQEKQMAWETRQELSSRFPACFQPHGTSKQPLKIGIKHDVLAAAPDLDPRAVVLAFKDYCTGESYLTACIVGANRIDLAGAPAGTVTEKEVISTRQRIGWVQRLERRAQSELKKHQRWMEAARLRDKYEPLQATAAQVAA